MASLQDLLLTNNGAFGTGSPAEESQKPSFLGNLLLGLTKSAATLPQRAIQNSQFALNTGNYDPAVPMEAALGLTGGAGIVPAEANSLRMGIKAYHGSPHDFDAFSMDKIGTGEGAQAYGHGLYFADNEGVAKSYRDALAPVARNLGNDQTVAGLLKTSGNDLDKAIAAANDRASKYRVSDPLYNEYKTAADKLQDMKAQNVAPAGHMYEVNIDADPAHFLDWDKPLSQQSPKVQDAAKQAMGPNWDEFKYAKAGDAVKQGFLAPGADTTAAALRDAGIPGIKYLDQGSRTAGEGSSNYVVFKDDIINIVRKYAAAGIAVPPAIMAQYQKINEQQ